MDRKKNVPVPHTIEYRRREKRIRAHKPENYFSKFMCVVVCATLDLQLPHPCKRN